MADRVYIIEKGRLRFVGSFAELEARPDLRDDYLGDLIRRPMASTAESTGDALTVDEDRGLYRGS